MKRVREVLLKQKREKKRRKGTKKRKRGKIVKNNGFNNYKHWKIERI